LITRTADRHRLDIATERLDPPFGVLDLPALQANAADLVRRAAGRPIRLASKSIRCRAVLLDVLAMDGFAGVLAYTLSEAIWLAADIDDVVVGYPTADRAALRRLDPRLAGRITLMVDSVEQLDFIDAVAPDHPELRLCLDVDASLRLWDGRVHIGARRSPVHSVAQATEFATAVRTRPGFRLVGIMSYEGQIAGVGNSPPGRPVRGLTVRAMQAVSGRELAERRGKIVNAVRSITPLEFVNGGGTGSVERTAREDAVTEIAAGSGLFAPRLFDSYRSFSLQPAALFALSVTRRPGPGIVTVSGGGWIASGPAGKDRLPIPVYPPGLSMLPTEAAGEVQTPLTGRHADQLQVGDRVWFRHAKAGELSEHLNELHIVDGADIVRTVPTYRGEQQAFL
jgi:D-serine deaminase-like pyridoxal phosphate-dependent protein